MKCQRIPKKVLQRCNHPMRHRKILPNGMERCSNCNLIRYPDARGRFKHWSTPNQ